MKRNVRIQGIGSYLPKRLVTASEIDQMIGAEDGWSEKKSGVKKRHFVKDETASFMGAEAAKLALQDEHMSFSQIAQGYSRH
ncbi:hypothetical protein V7122_02240 [Bacillus sp. JJ1532]|uniref:hypothetical protein n=1 Tax=unclassified Bacillus (in: firmicutes) TaxID=185979 RepID=UPI002FFE0288